MLLVIEIQFKYFQKVEMAQGKGNGWNYFHCVILCTSKLN